MVDTLKIKCDRALKKTGIDHLVIAGGVSANQHLRKYLKANLAPPFTMLHQSSAPIMEL